jgi:hypothetical protein
VVNTGKVTQQKGLILTIRLKETQKRVREEELEDGEIADTEDKDDVETVE